VGLEIFAGSGKTTHSHRPRMARAVAIHVRLRRKIPSTPLIRLVVRVVIRAVKERSILTTTEIDELYSPPVFSDEDQRFFFTLSDQEQENAARSRSRQKRCMFVLLLGYFKSKPVVLKPRYYTIKNDLQSIAAHVFPGKQYRPFSLEEREIERLYDKVFTALKSESNAALQPSNGE
jgi:hypothetical protein